MSDAIRSFPRSSSFKVLTEEQERMVHERCLQVLERTGVSTTNEGLLKVMADHGQQVDFEKPAHPLRSRLRRGEARPRTAHEHPARAQPRVRPTARR
jgi:trimethylamine:corrinoid methyltransferase-like protein